MEFDKELCGCDVLVSGYTEKMTNETFNADTDLLYIEQHYGQKLTTE